MLQVGQWATFAPVSARSRRSSSVSQMQWARTVRGPSTPSPPRYATSVPPSLARRTVCASFSAAWVWIQASCSSAAAATSFHSPSVALRDPRGQNA